MWCRSMIFWYYSLTLATTLALNGCGDTTLQAHATGPQHNSYALLARDPLTGEYGVAAASHAPLIGLNLEFLDPEAGAVIALGGPHLQVNRRTLIALQDGLSPGRAIAVGLTGDAGREERQVLALSPAGAAAFSGEELPKHAGHRTGSDFVAAGNLLESDAVLAALEETFTSSQGALADRLLAALQAARDAGGEKGGAHSAALVIVGLGARFATRDRLVDLRIDFVPGDAVAALAQLQAQVDSVYEVR